MNAEVKRVLSDWLLANKTVSVRYSKGEELDGWRIIN